MQTNHPALTTFGEPETTGDLAEMLALPERRARLTALGDARQALEQISRRLMADYQLYRRGGRWQPQQPDPATFVPGDVVALRYLAAEPAVRILLLDSQHQSGSALLLRLVTDPGAWHIVHDTYWTLTAVPFFLPASDAVGVMASHPPTPEDLADLHLPFPAVTIYFAADLALDPSLLRWSDRTDSQELAELLRRKAERSRVHLTPLEALSPGAVQYLQQLGLSPAAYQQLVDDYRHPLPRSWLDPLWGLQHLGGYLTGVTLFAGPAGAGLADDVLWTVAANPDPDAPPRLRNDRIRALVLGRLSRSILRPLAENLAAVVAWGAWQTPTPTIDLPGTPGSTEWHKATRRGKFRRQERNGALAGVRVLDVARLNARAAAFTRATGRGETRQSPITHLRRGHVRRVRIGPRHNWTYKRVWIPPTVVNPGGPASPDVRVYRVPVPDLPRHLAPPDPGDTQPPPSLRLPAAMRRTATSHPPPSQAIDPNLSGRSID